MHERDEIERSLERMLVSIKARDPRFAFDREGRPGAIAAVREALPSMERNLFDAILEDCECELAALREALFQMVSESDRSR